MILLLSIICGGLPGCAGLGLAGLGLTGSGLNRAGFRKGEQWEPEVEEASTNKDWRNAPSTLRKGSDRKSTEDPIDKLLWSDEARDINRSLGGSL